MSKDKEQQKRDDVQWVLSTEQGRRFVWELLSYCGVYRSLEGDANSMMVQEGSRRVGLFLLGITSDVSEELVFKMMLEAKNRTIEENRHDNANDRDRSDEPPRAFDDSYDSVLTGQYESGDELPSYDTLQQFF